MTSMFSRFGKTVVFIVLAVMVTVISLTVYAAVQQNYRMGANDPQIDASAQIASLLAQGAPAQAIVGQSSPVDMSTGLGLFIMIFDKDGKLLGSSGKLNGADPSLPNGVINYAKQNIEDRFTWQPQKGVRVAAVIRKADKDTGYVLTGRSLSEVEKRINNLTLMVGIAWIMLLALCVLLTWALGAMIAPQNITVVENTEVINMPPPTEE